MRPVLDLMERVGPSDANVLITGEHGTGKELVAEWLHASSPRAAKPLIAVNMGGLSEGVFESEMFGHVRGAFTDARTERMGRVELADGGTLFLDEIGELPASLQATLLGVLERQRLRRLGGRSDVQVDVRVLCATHRDLRLMESFREDLYYRLSVFPIEVAPLRERLDDIPLLVDVFARRCSQARERPLRFTPEAMLGLTRYGWPGNVRELRNVVERLAVMTSGTDVTAEEVAFNLPGTAPETEAALPTLEEVERRHILRVLRRTDGNRAQAAKILGVDPKTLYNKMKAYLPRMG